MSSTILFSDNYNDYNFPHEKTKTQQVVWRPSPSALDLGLLSLSRPAEARAGETVQCTPPVAVSGHALAAAYLEPLPHPLRSAGEFVSDACLSSFAIIPPDSWGLLKRWHWAAPLGQAELEGGVPYGGSSAGRVTEARVWGPVCAVLWSCCSREESVGLGTEGLPESLRQVVPS